MTFDSEESLELLIITFFCTVSHTSPALELQDWSYSELNPNFFYADRKTKDNPFTLLLNVICCPHFLIRNSFFKYFLVARTSVYFLNLPILLKLKQHFSGMLNGLGLSSTQSTSMLRRRTDIWA